MTEPTPDLRAGLARAMWSNPEGAFKLGEAEDPDDVFESQVADVSLDLGAEAEPDRPLPLRGRFAVSVPDEVLRELQRTARKAGQHGATERQVVASVVLGFRGLALGGPDEDRLVAILAGIWQDAEEQRAAGAS